MVPTIGRIVHYQEREGLPPCAALVTWVCCAPGDNLCGEVNLTVFSHEGYTRPVWDAPFAEEPTPGHWNWPPR